jgi:hypothetical protein
MHKGMNTTVDEGQTPIVTTGGVFSVRTAQTSANGHGIAEEKSHTLDGAQGQAVCFKPSHFTRGKDGKPSDVAPPLSADADKGGQDTVVCATGQRTHALTTRAACEEDASQPHAVAFTQNQREEVRILDVASACSAEPGSHQQTYIAQPAVAYVKATNPHSKEEAPRYEEAAVSACLNGWDERHDPPKHMVAACRNPATEALYTKGYSGGQRDACTQEADAGKTLRVLRQEVGEEDFAQWGLGILDSFQCKEVLRSGLLGQGDGEEEEVSESEAGREVVGGSSKGKKHLPEGRLSEVWQAGRDRRTSQGWKLSQQLSRELGAYLQKLPLEGAPKEAVVLDLWKASEGLRVLRDALPEVQEVGRSAGDEVEPVRSDSTAQQGHQTNSMCVRRLTVKECEFLQGFPAGHTDIVFRKKPAADGPRYRALGNSMAVPCMVWLGRRIQQATKGDNT